MYDDMELDGWDPEPCNTSLMSQELCAHIEVQESTILKHALRVMC